MGFVVDELFAFIATGEDGDEGVMAALMGDTWMPMVAADLIRVQAFAPLAKIAAEQNDIEYKLKHFKLLGDVSDEYLEQFEDIEEPAKEADVPGDADTDEQQPDDSGGSNGSGENIH